MQHVGHIEGAPVWPSPRPMSDAPKDARILAYFGPNRGGWYVCSWQEGNRWKGFWCPDGYANGTTWARANQPQCWLPLPPKVEQAWEFRY